MADVEKPTEEVPKCEAETAKSAEEPVADESNTAETTEEKPTETSAAKDPVADESNATETTEDKPAEISARDIARRAPSKFESKIIRQIEFYFGDSNLIRDKFLLQQIAKDEEGWVPLSVLLTFRRLSSLSNDPEVIIKALGKSDEGLVEISEDKEKLRRHPERPIPEHNEERRKEIMSRTAYAKGFPLDVDMSELIEFFHPFDKVVNITMRKYVDKPTKTYKFKGSVFVTFEKKEQTKDFIEKEKVMFKERELTRKWQEAYLEEKKEEMKAKSKKKQKVATEDDKIQLPKGTVLHFEGSGEEVTREMLRGAVEKVEGDWELAYVDYTKGEPSGHIRFHQENSAATFLEMLEDNKLKLSDDGSAVTLRTLTEEEEKEFLDKAVEYMKNRRSHQNKHKGGHHHHHHGNRKRRGGHENRNGEKRKKLSDD